jgi:hypothetical protein
MIWRSGCLVFVIGCAAPDGATVRDQLEVLGPAGSAPAAIARTWRPLANPAPFSAGAPLLLTDGTVMVQELDTSNWWRLTPGITGSYGNGTWSARASMPSDYSPLYFASAVLPDGRVIVEGGEYVAGSSNPPFGFSRRGELYDPVADKWTSIAPPNSWGTIGDASGIVLPNGVFMLSDCCSTKTALFNPQSLTWRDTGLGKLDINDEESWALLPDGTVLTVDANNPPNSAKALAYELYDPATGTWTSPGSTPIRISDTLGANPSHEVGPEVLRPDGTVLALGGNGHNAAYDTKTKTWATLPDLPIVGGQQLDVADGPAALMPNGDVLFAASPGVFNNPVTMFEFDGTKFTAVAGPPEAANNTSYANFFLVLPTGEIFLAEFTNDVEIYTPAPGIVEGAVPVIETVPELVERATPRLRKIDSSMDRLRPLTTLQLGRTYKVGGKRFSGVSQGAYYGDDNQSSTNFPLVRLTNVTTKHVAFCRTHDHSTRSVAPEERGTTLFDVALDTERGLANMVVIANGIASPPILVNIK